MDARTSRQNAFEPVSRAIADAWLQVRAKPLVYILIWLTLALAPYLLLGLAFSAPLMEAFGNFVTVSEEMGTAESMSDPLPPGFVSASIRLLGLYALIMAMVSLVAVYMGGVLAGTVRRFRESTFPRYGEAMAAGVHLFPRFITAVLIAAGYILARPAAALAVGGVLSYAVRQPTIFTLSLFVGMFMSLSGLYRYGLAPFVHLSLGIAGRDACRASRAYHLSHRSVVAALFLALVLVPFIILSMLFMLFLGSGLYFGIGSLLLWFVQSVLQFTVVMTLINFAMNTFVPEKLSMAQPSSDSDGT